MIGLDPKPSMSFPSSSWNEYLGFEAGGSRLLASSSSTIVSTGFAESRFTALSLDTEFELGINGSALDVRSHFCVTSFVWGNFKLLVLSCDIDRSENMSACSMERELLVISGSSLLLLTLPSGFLGAGLLGLYPCPDSLLDSFG